MVEINLRDYQNGINTKIREKIKSRNKHILVQLPTGGGKTVIFSYIALNAAKKGNKVLIITDREELLSQAGATIRKFDLHPSFIKAGSKFIDRRKNIYIAMSQTLRNRIGIQEWRDFILNEIEIVIIDEAHIQEFNYLFEDGILDTKLVLGFTATPSRSGKMRQLGLDYEVLIRGAEPKDLIKLGYLLNCDLYEAESPDMAGVKINTLNNDYSEQSMFERFDKPTLYKGLINNYREKADGKRMIVFCCNIEHAIKTTVELSNAGYRAKFVSSEVGKPVSKNSMTEAELAVYNEKQRKYDYFLKYYTDYSGPRKQVIQQFKQGEFEIIVNVDILTKGFDDPSVEVVAVYRATTSMTLWLQMLGRGSRTYDENKTHFIALDFGANAKRLGNYDSNRTWSLWHETRKGGGVPPVKECGHTSKGKPIKSSNEVEKGCRRLILASYTLCPFCGFKYPEKKEAKEIELSLSKISTEEGIVINSKSITKMNWQELTDYRKIKGHKQPWLWRQLWIRGKEQELRAYAAQYFWNPLVTEKAVNYCKNNLS